MNDQVTKPAPQQSPWMELIFNIALPSLIMIKGGKEEYLGPFWGVIVALLFPLGYGIYDFVRQRKINGFSILGLVSVLLTGAVTIFDLNPLVYAIKEAAIPGLIGLVVLVSLKFKTPLVKKLLLNDSVVDTARIEAALQSNNNKERFDKCLVNASLMLSVSFFVSALLNYVLARWIVKSPVQSEQYAEEVGKMQLLSYPVILVPSLIMMGFTLWYLFSGIRKLTGLEFGTLMRNKA